LINVRTEVGDDTEIDVVRIPWWNMPPHIFHISWRCPITKSFMAGRVLSG